MNDLISCQYFSAIADFYGRKTSFYVGIVTVMLFTYLQIPVSYSYDLFALFKVTFRFCIRAPYF